MVCVDQMCSPPSGCCNWRVLGAWRLFPSSQGCNIGRIFPFQFLWVSSPILAFQSSCNTRMSFFGVRLVYNVLQLIIEVFNVITIVVSCWGYTLQWWWMLNCDAFRRMVMSRLETGRHPMMAFTVSLWVRNPTPCSCLSSRPLKKSLWPSGVDVSPKFFQRTSQSPRMFYRYLLISCVSFSTFPAALSDLTFQVPMVMLFLARSDFGPSVAYFFTSTNKQTISFSFCLLLLLFLVLLLLLFLSFLRLRHLRPPCFFCAIMPVLFLSTTLNHFQQYLGLIHALIMFTSIDLVQADWHKT